VSAISGWAVRAVRDLPTILTSPVEFAIGIGATGKTIDRLEKRGWAARQPNPSDRRSSLLALTDDGHSWSTRQKGPLPSGWPS
jgi:hypothetical protein